MKLNGYKEDREINFNKIKSSFKAELEFESPDALLLAGDSLELIKKIPDHSISLILTDPPYHTTKKKNIKNDTAFESDNEFLAWINEYTKEWYRILRPNGSIYVYCSCAMAARIEVLMMKQFNILSHIVWTKPNDPGFDGWKQKMKKESLRQWYDHSERIIFAEPAYDGNLNKSSFGNFLKSVRLQSNLSGHQLTEMIGAYGKVNHGGSVHNWEAGRNIPSREQYSKIREAILSIGKVQSMPPYEDIIRPFEVTSSVEFTDVWNFFSVRPYDGKHPAEKPMDMLEHSIVSATYEGDIVLDCFAGSGSTAIASLNTGRKTISIELDENWIKSIKTRLENYRADSNGLHLKKKHDIMKITRREQVSMAGSLFS
ncbi:MAG: DNA-methyltransferase [Bacteroidia bacterium]